MTGRADIARANIHVPRDLWDRFRDRMWANKTSANKYFRAVLRLADRDPEFDQRVLDEILNEIDGRTLKRRRDVSSGGAPVDT